MTTIVKTCRTCRHWAMPECRRIDTSEGDRVLPREAAMVTDADAFDPPPSVALHTGPEFGCTLWEGTRKNT